MCDENLSKEFKEAMDEVKALMQKSLVNELVSNIDTCDIEEGTKALGMIGRLCDLFGNLYEKVDKLCDKMNKMLEKQDR